MNSQSIYALILSILIIIGIVFYYYRIWYTSPVNKLGHSNKHTPHIDCATGHSGLHASTTPCPQSFPY